MKLSEYIQELNEILTKSGDIEIGSIVEGTIKPPVLQEVVFEETQYVLNPETQSMEVITSPGSSKVVIR